jgi:uncharacterized membrane protein/protein-disulfide isomerase
VARPKATTARPTPGLSRRARTWLLVCALLGLAVSTSATYVHYRLLHEPGYTSFCDIDTTVSCSQVYLSRYGAVGGVPVALLGALWFLVALVLVAGAARGSAAFRENVAGYLFVLSTLALAVVLYLAYASFVVLRTACILCLATYAAVIGIFLVSGAATTIPMRTLPRRLVGDLRALASSRVALAVSILLLAGAASAIAFFPRGPAAQPAAAAAAPAAPAAPPAAAGADRAAAPAGSQASEFERWYWAQPRVNLPVPNGGAKVLIVKFNDYQCPACGQSYDWYKPILAKYEATHPGQVRFVSLDFPLHPACNAAVTRVVHIAACEAAVAVRLARERGKAQAMEEWLYANQTATPEMVRAAARDVAGVTDFDARYAALLQAVKTDAALGGLNNVRSTPTFFINGTMIVGALPPQYFDQAIALELARAGERR